MGLAFELVWWLLAVLAMSFIGLWSIWAGLGRAHWFVRMVVLLGWISLVLVIPAYELLVLFLVQAGVTIAILSAWRAWRSLRTKTAGQDELPSGSLPQSRWQYSIRDLLLLAVLVAWLAAMLTRVPARGLDAIAGMVAHGRHSGRPRAGRSLDRLEQTPLVAAIARRLRPLSISPRGRLAHAGAGGRIHADELEANPLEHVDFAGCSSVD